MVAYLLTREQATRRYNVSLRTLVELYRRDPEFPVLLVGKKVLIHREQADEWFDDYVGGKIDMG